jgi:transposase
MKDKLSVIVGADISDKKIDICITDKDNDEVLLNKAFLNNLSGHKRFIQDIKKYSSVLVVMEATGNYHKKFAAQLAVSSIRFSIVNPLVIRRFAQMKLIRTKTDKVDAHIIACYGKEQTPKEYQAPSEVQQQMKALTTVLNNLIKQRTQSKNLLHSQLLLPDGNPQGQKAIKKVIFTLNTQIKKIETDLDKIIKAHFADLYKNITSIKGIGNKTAQGVIATLGDLRSFSSYKQISSFVGISPAIRQSGFSLNKTCGITKQGNTLLRTLFYLSALSASRCNKKCKELYIRLLQKGKKKKTALIAVANKLIKQLFAIVKSNNPYVDDFIHPKYVNC